LFFRLSNHYRSYIINIQGRYFIKNDGETAIRFGNGDVDIGDVAIFKDGQFTKESDDKLFPSYEIARL
jgi:hypothetical protein